MNMSMLSVGNLDNKIISSSVQIVSNPLEQNKKAVEPKNEGLSNKAVYALTGAAALASIAIACIALSRGKCKAAEKEVSSTVNSSLAKLEGNISNPQKLPVMKPYKVEIPEVKEEKVQKIVDKIFAYDEKNEEAIKTAEKKVRDEIRPLFSRFADDYEDIPQFRYRAQDVVYSHPEPLTLDSRKLEKDDLKAVLSFIKNPQYNAKLSAGEDLSSVNEVNVMRKLIDEALPIEKQSYVYTGIRTQKIWDNYAPLDFVENLENGAIIKDKSFLVTSRGYGDYLAEIDPVNLGKDHRDSGYILRIMLPEGTKGFDFRRCSKREDSLSGINALYVLPENSEILIRNIDNKRRIIDCKYILPSAK